MSSKRGKKRPHQDEFNKSSTSNSNRLSNEDGVIASEDLPEKVREIRSLFNEMELNYTEQMEQIKTLEQNSDDRKRNNGIHCIKFNKDECIFQFTIYDDDEHIKTYTVQIFNENNKGTFGVLDIPLAIDLHQVVKETPLDNIVNTPIFVRNLKLHLDMYHRRKKQYDDLKSYLEDVCNCSVDVHYSYTIVFITFLKCKDLETNIYFNIIVYVFYDLTKENPIEVKFDLNSFDDIDSTNMKQHLESFFECFKTLTLKEAFIQIIEQDNAPMEWKLEKYDTILNLSDLSDFESSDDDISQMSTPKKKQTKQVVKKPSYTKIKKATVNKVQTNKKSQSKKDGSTEQYSQGDSQTNMNVKKTEKTNKKKKKKLQDTMRQTKLNFTLENANDKNVTGDNNAISAAIHVNKKRAEQLKQDNTSKGESNDEIDKIDEISKVNSKGKPQKQQLANKLVNSNKTIDMKRKSITKINTIKRPHSIINKRIKQPITTSTPLHVQTNKLCQPTTNDNLDISEISKRESVNTNNHNSSSSSSTRNLRRSRN